MKSELFENDSLSIGINTETLFYYSGGILDQMMNIIVFKNMNTDKKIFFQSLKYLKNIKNYKCLNHEVVSFFMMLKN